MLSILIFCIAAAISAAPPVDYGVSQDQLSIFLIFFLVSLKLFRIDNNGKIWKTRRVF